MKMLLSVKLKFQGRWLHFVGCCFVLVLGLSQFFRKWKQQVAMFRKVRSLLGQLGEVAEALPVAFGPKEMPSVP